MKKPRPKQKRRWLRPQLTAEDREDRRLLRVAAEFYKRHEGQDWRTYSTPLE